jgi:putative DNA primase/helicase
MLKQAPTKELARGRWASILPTLGITPEFLTGKHCSCPLCGGKDRFRFDNKDGLGTYFCSQCGSGDGFMLAEKFTKRSFKEIATHIQGMWHTVKSMPQDKRDEVAQQRAIRNAWEGSWQPSPRSSVGLYHSTRFSRPWASKSIRENAGGMVALIHGVDDSPVNVHLTALTKDGAKNESVGTIKKVMPGKLPEGCAIRIWDAAPVMGIAEGIETAISAAILFKMPVWAAVNGSLLAKWIPPEVAETVHIFGDNDSNFTGQSKAYALANRLYIQFERKVVVHIPDQCGKDWNDILKDTQSGNN